MTNLEKTRDQLLYRMLILEEDIQLHQESIDHDKAGIEEIQIALTQLNEWLYWDNLIKLCNSADLFAPTL